MTNSVDRLKVDKLRALEEKKRLKELLPFKFAFRDYSWSHEFLHSRNRLCLLTAANQIGKSTIQIRRMLTWATEKALWPELWPGKTPNLFWYLYPSKEVATMEWNTKWLPMMPQGEMKEHPDYGWKEEWDKDYIKAIHFNSGVILMFRTYAQDVSNLQSGTVYAIGCDEELPYDLYDELKFRLNATRGYFSCVFTATLGQEFWRLAMEERGTPVEKFPKAAKWQVSLFECVHYRDGTPSQWTLERISEVIEDCSDEDEIQKRVYGRFVLAKDRVYHGFTIKNNVKYHQPAVDKKWFVYAGIDYGSGGKTGHPSAIVFIAVNPEMTKGRVFKAWRGDKIETTANDVVLKYMAMAAEVKGLGLTIVQTCYDWAAKDLYKIASSLGISLVKAEKAHDIGEKTLNSVFKKGVLELDGDDAEIMKLAYELTGFKAGIPKNKAKDDLIDSARYVSVMVPWNWEAVLPSELRAPVVEAQPLEPGEERRHGIPVNPDEVEYESSVQAEFDEWNEAYGN